MTFIMIFLAFFILLFIAGLYAIRALKNAHLKTSLKKGRESGSKENLIATLQKLVHKDPENIQIRMQLISLYMEVENFSEAVFHINSILSHARNHPNFDEKRLNGLLAECYTRLGRHDDACRVYSFLAVLDPKDVNPYLQIGKIELKRGNREKAIRQFEKVLSIDPGNVPTLKELGKLYFRQKKFNEALERLENALAASPDDPEINYYLGEIMYCFRKPGKAFRHFRKAGKDRRFSVKSMFIMAQLLRKAGRLDEARKMLSGALQLPGLKREQIITIQYDLGEVCLEQNDIPEAVDQWQSILSKTATYKDVHEKLDKYEQMKTNYALRQYMMSGKSEFVELCKDIIEVFTRNAAVLRTDAQGNYYADFLVQAIYKGIPTMILFKFFRGTGKIGHLAVREFYEKVKEFKAKQGVCFTNTEFSEEAASFAEGRVLELYGKEKLLNLVTKALKRSK